MAADTAQQNGSNVQSLRSEVEFQFKSQDLNKKIFAAANLDEILIDLKDDIVELFDAETGRQVLLDTGSAEVRADYAKQARSRQRRLEELLRKVGIDYIQVMSGQDYVRDLVRFFRGRERRQAKFRRAAA